MRAARFDLVPEVASEVHCMKFKKPQYPTVPVPVTEFVIFNIGKIGALSKKFEVTEPIKPVPYRYSCSDIY